MITKIYRVKGTFVMGDEYHEFTKDTKLPAKATSRPKSMKTWEANMVSTGTRFQSTQSRKSLLKTWKTQS